jgi:hypothetical protein
MTKVKINLYINENDPVNDTTVGIALGKAIMRSELTYEEDITQEQLNKETQRRLLLLDFLEELGVDNWDGYSEAIKLSKEYYELLGIEEETEDDLP